MLSLQFIAFVLFTRISELKLNNFVTKIIHPPSLYLNMELKSAKYNLLINKHKDKIYGYAFLMMKNKMDADDVTQEVFIKIWQNIDKFNFHSAKAWIFRTTYNLCIDYLRKQKSAAKVFEYSDENIFNLSSNDRNSDNPYFQTHLKFMDEKIKNAIQNLTENYRSIIILYEIQNLKYKEISKILDMPINSVKVNLLRARKKLREKLNYEPLEVL